MDPHQLLGIAPDASLDEAEDAYRRLLLIHHPDLHHDADAARRSAAERTTRRLNAAIAQLRSGVGAPTMAGGPFRPSAPGTRGAPGTSGPRGGAGAARAAGSAGATGSASSAGPWWATSGPGPTGAGTTCPMCGAPAPTRAVLQTHVAAAHDIHLDHRLRTTKVRRHRRPLRGLRFHSPWALLPVNALAALALATAAGQLTRDLMFARWTFAVAMAPTIIQALTRGHDG